MHIYSSLRHAQFVSCYLYVCLQSRPFGPQKPINVLFPGQNFFSQHQYSLVAYSSFQVCLLLFLFSSCLDCHVHETLWV